MKTYYAKAKIGRAADGWFFQNCVTASFAKAYEFNVLVNSSNEGSTAFFLTAGLRSICEDLILLRYLGALSKANREQFIVDSMAHEVLVNLRDQKQFFTENRRFQMILNPPADIEVRIDQLIGKLQVFWKHRGWNLRGKNTMPQIRQLAKRRGVETLYDYIYRLTCDVVHFNPQVLLRSGWGGLPEVEFSTHNFDLYYRNFAAIYGALLFCLYFQLLKRFLKPSRKVFKIVKQIEKSLKDLNRWPELVTFEEMNVKPPWDGSPILQIVHRVMVENQEGPERENRWFDFVVERLLFQSRPL